MDKGRRTTRTGRRARLTVAKSAAGLAVLLALGLMTSGALADGDPFAPLGALTGDTSSSTSSDSGATTDATSTTTTTTAAPAAGAPFIVTFTAATSSDAQLAAISAAGATAGDPIPALHMYSVTADDAAAAALRADPTVVSVDADLSRDTAGTPDDTRYADQWSLPRISWDQVYGSVDPSGSAVVAILDTGVDASHPDLAGKVMAGTDIVTGSGDGEADPNGHGTAMAGIVAAATGNGEGIAGIGYAGVQVLPVTVLGPDGTGTDSDVISGLVYAVQHGADVILMSFSNPGFSAPLQAAIDYAWSHDVVVVAATGNDGSSTVNYPAGDRGVLGVASTDESDAPSSSSNAGADVFIAAPGEGILSTQAGGGYGSVSGTSASAAMVAGAAALIRADSTGISNGVVVNRLAANADSVGSASRTGNGRLNLARAIADTSTTSIEPAGSGGGGGPFVGPYHIANKNLVITFAGGGSGSIAFSGVSPSSPAPSPNPCTSTCSVALDNNAAGTLTVTPGTNSTFAGWAGTFVSGGTTTCSSTTSPCTFSMNNAAQALTATFTGDTTPPSVVSINRSGSTPTNATSVSWTVTFSESVTGVDSTDFAFANSGLTGPSITGVTGSGANWTVTATTGTGSGALGLNLVDNDSIVDGASNKLGGTGANNGNFTGQVYGIDKAAPTVTINQASGQPDPTSSSPINFTVVFSESVTGLNGADVSLAGTAGATTATVTGSGTTYNVAVSGMTADGSVIATVPAGAATDTAGNANTASTSTDNTVTYDTTKPAVTVNQAAGQSDPTNAQPINFTAVFSEPINAATFTSTDVTIGGTAGGPKTVTITNPSADNKTFNLVVSGAASDGTEIASIAAGGVSDPAGNTNTVSTSTDNTVSYDTTKPTVTVNQAAGQNDPTNAQPINFTAAFNEPIDTATFNSSDVTIGGTAGGTKSITITNPSADKKTFNVAVSGAASDGTETVSIGAGLVNDLAGNSNTTSTSADNTVTYDATKPTVTIDQASGQADPTNQSPIHFTAVFSEPVSGFTAADVSIGGTAGGATTVTITNPSADNENFHIAVSGMSDGSVIATIPAGGASDPAGNTNAVSTSTDNTVTYDTTSSTVTSVSATNANGTYTTGDTIHVTITFDEPVYVTGTPRLQLETGATDEYALFSSGSGTTTLTFDYHVVTGDASADLDELSASALTLNGGSIEDAATNDADLTLPSPGAAGSLGANRDIVIDTTADLSVAKSDGETSVTAGAATTHTYTVTVTNHGPATATGITLADTFPTGLSRGAVTPSQGSGCSGSTSFTCALGTLANGASATVTVAFTVPSSTTADQTNSVSVTSDIADGNDANDSASDTDTVETSADLSVSKTGPASATAGDPDGFDYKLSAHNGGPSDNDGFIVSDTLPAGLTFQAADSDPNCAAVGQDVTCFASALAAGADREFTVHVTLASTGDSSVTLSNSASITSTGTTDPNPANDSSTTVDTSVTEDVHLSVVKSFGSGSVTAGGASRTFTIAVSNSGVSDADHVHVMDVLDGRLVFESASGGGFDCSASAGQSVDCSLAHLGAGATRAVTVSYHVDSTTDSADSVGDSASAQSDEDGPTSGSDSVDIVEDVQLSVSKSFDSQTVTAGGAGKSFTIEVTNSGVSDADNLSLVDSVDGRLLVDSIDAGDYDCSASSGQSIDCSLAHLAAGATKSITVHYRVASTTDSDLSVGNSAAASSDEDSSEGSDSVAIVEDVQLSVNKTFSSDTVVAGGSAKTFTIDVTNNGASDADHVVLDDPVPSRLVVDSVDVGAYTCPDGDSDPQTITCTLDHLAAGATASITVTYHVDTTTEADAGVTNSATASSDEQVDTIGSDTVAIAEDVDLVVTKQFADGAVDAGTTDHTFTISVENTGASQADNLEVTDSVDPRLVVTGLDDGGLDCSSGALQSIDCTAAHLDSGDTKTITVTYKVSASTAAATVSNAGAATADDGGTGDSTTSVHITTNADVADLKVVSAAPHVAGTAVTYTSTVTNNGPSDAQDVTFSDPLDPSLTDPHYCLGSGCTPDTDWTGSVSLGTIPAGETRSIVITATIDPSTPQDSQVTNTSSATSSSTTDPKPSNNDSDVTITVDTRADLTLHKDAPSTATAGDPAGFDYTLTVHNAGPSDNSGGFHVTDTLPDGLTFDSSGSSAGCSASGRDVTCSSATGLAAGGDTPFTVHVTADATLDTGTLLSNSGLVASDGTVDPDVSNDTSNTTTTSVVEDVRLSLTKVFGSETVTAGGDSQTFTLTAHNAGFSDADNLVLSDMVDSRLAVDSTSGDFDCGTASQTLNCTLAHLGPDSDASLTVTYHVAASTLPDASVDNEASVTSDENTATGDDQVEIVTAADLQLTKSAPATAIAGDPGGFDYTIKVENNGPSDNTGGFTVIDPLAPDLTFDSTGSSAGCAPGGSTVTCTNTTGLAAGDDEEFTVHVTLASTVDSGTDISNTATVTSDGTTDPEGTNNSDTMHTTAHEDVHLSVVKSFGSGSVTAGGASRTFTIAVSNSGVSDADHVHVMDVLDGRLVFESASGGGFDCSASAGQSVDCSLAHLGAGATRAVTVSYHVDSTTDSADSVGDSASAQSDEDGPTSGSDSVDIVEDVQLSVSKSFDSQTVTAGGAGKSFTIEVTNSGVSDADNLSLVDSVDGRLLVDSIDAGDYDCSASSGQSIDCSLAHLAAGATKSITVHYRVASTTDSDLSVGNSAAASSDEDSSEGSDSVAIVEDVQLSVNKTFSSDTVVAGGSAKTFTIDVTNNGASDADHLDLTDAVDARLAVDSIDNGDYSCSDASQTVDCTLAHLAAGATESITVTYHVSASTTPATVTNTAGSTSDEVASAVTGSDSLDIETHADLSVTKIAPVTATAGDPDGFDYAIEVKNNGPSDNTGGFAVTDTLAPELTFHGTGSTTGCTASAQVVTCTHPGGLANGGTASFTLHVTLAATADSTLTIHNTATVASTGTDDPTSENNTSSPSADTQVQEDVHLAVTKAFDAATVTAGGSARTFTVSVTNSGLSDADHVTVTDSVDPRLRVDSFGGDFTCGTASQSISCTMTHLDPGATKKVVVTYHVASTTDSASNVGNIAHASSDEVADAHGESSVDIVEDVHLSVVKAFAAGSVTAGGVGSSFTIAVTNSGVSDADNLSVVDSADGRLIVDSASGGGFTCGTGQSISCTLAHLDAGATATITVNYHVGASTLPASVSNTASAKSDEATATDSTTSVNIVTDADLSITKVSSVASFNSWDPAGFDYTITVKNDGPSDNSGGFTVSDTLPTGLSFQAGSSSGTCSATGQLVTCTGGSLAVSGTQSFTIHVTATGAFTDYQVVSNQGTVATNGTGDSVSGNNTSTAATTTIRVDTTKPTSTIVFPVTGGSYKTAVYNAGCTPAGSICGTAADAGPGAVSGVKSVAVSIKQQPSGLYWNGSAFASGSEVFLAASGMTSWSYGFAPPADGTYVVRSQVTDYAGNIESPSTMTTFTIDNVPPNAPVITSTTPPSPANNNMPAVNGAAEAGSKVKIYTDGACAGTSLGYGTATGGAFSIIVTVADNSLQTFYASATDAAGNVSPCSNGIVYLEDSAKPVATVTGVTNGATYTLGSVPQPGCLTTDPGPSSGIKTQATVTVTGATANGVGAITATCAGAADNAGNTSTPGSVTYTIQYNWGGFLQPINDTAHDIGSSPDVSTFKAGSTIPVKFAVYNAAGAPVSAGVVAWLTPVKGNATSQPVDELQFTDTPSVGANYTYDGQKYQYNWGTAKSAAGYYWKITVKLDDGTSHSVYISLR